MPAKTSAKKTARPDAAAIQNRLDILRSPWKMKYFYFKRLPSVWWWGIGIRYIDQTRAEISLPFSWRTQNPFRSIYFAAQVGAAELSTGLLAMLALEGYPPVSMLVTKVDSEFVKKADGTVIFTCEQGEQLQATIAKAIQSGEGESVTIESVGRMANDVVVSRVWITWSFKARRKKA